MKKFNKGFSLAELLITISIIGIIASVGISVSKIGVDNAYRLYYYTGYAGISNAINHVLNQNVEPLSGGLNFRSTTFATRIREVLSAEVVNDCKSPDNNPMYDNLYACFKAPNGISYTLAYIEQDSITINDETIDISKFLIRMNVPHKRGATGTSTCFEYHHNSEYDFLIPIETPTQVRKPYGICSDTMSIQNRMDLLPFYLQEDLTGKLISKYNKNTATFNPPNPNDYKKRKYMSFKDAFCTTEYKEGASYLGIDCSSYTESPKRAFIKVASPRDIR